MSFKVRYADRIYGWKYLYVLASSIAEAIKSAIQYLGFTPEHISACHEFELHLYSGLEPL